MEDFNCQFEKCAEKFSNNIAVLNCDNTKIINKLKYSEVFAISESVKKLLDNYVNLNSCIGIASTINPILASVILGYSTNKFIHS